VGQGLGCGVGHAGVTPQGTPQDVPWDPMPLSGGWRIPGTPGTLGPWGAEGAPLGLGALPRGGGLGRTPHGSAPRWGPGGNSTVAAQYNTLGGLLPHAMGGLGDVGQGRAGGSGGGGGGGPKRREKLPVYRTLGAQSMPHRSTGTMVLPGLPWPLPLPPPSPMGRDSAPEHVLDGRSVLALPQGQTRHTTGLPRPSPSLRGASAVYPGGSCGGVPGAHQQGEEQEGVAGGAGWQQPQEGGQDAWYLRPHPCFTACCSRGCCQGGGSAAGEERGGGGGGGEGEGGSPSLKLLRSS